ncbi:MAG: (deoxy)nucleoside triphosphate pyrophosphohydrolase [Magnetococcales bacterium]|nr:(deoxy)nucleoside triphosphate pyrophosphohydrolase [Magnetococcales bacterium]
MKRPGSLLVVAGILQKDGYYLLTQRRPGDSFALLWEFPGGKVHGNETPDAALIRELQEELGIVVQGFKPWRFVSHAYEHFHLLMLLYHVTSWQGEPQPLAAQQAKWFPLNDLKDVAMPPADIPLLHELLAHPLEDVDSDGC